MGDAVGTDGQLKEEPNQLWNFFVAHCTTLCDPMDCGTPGFPVLHCLPEFPETQVDDAIQPSHPLLPSSPPALSLSQHQGLFQ